METLILLLRKHKRLGYLFIPYLATKRDFFYSLKNRADVSNLRNFLPNDEQKKILKLLSEYDEHVLAKVFDNRKLTVKEFWEKLDEKKIENHIRPYIERKLAIVFHLLQTSPLPVFFIRKKQDVNVYENERIDIFTGKTATIFNFVKHEYGTRYFLSLRTDEEDIALYKKKGLVLTNKPCIVLVNKRLMLFEDIDGKKILPFFNKAQIDVPPRLEADYYKGFVRKSIIRYHVNGKGFEIIDVNVEKKAMLRVEEDFKGEYMLYLVFRYGDREIPAKEKQLIFVDFENKNGEIVFYKLTRNNHWEMQMKNLLKNYNFAESPEGIFKPRNLPFGENQKILFIKYLWKISNKLVYEGFVLEQNLHQKEYYLGDFYVKLSPGCLQNGTDYFGLKAIVHFGKFSIPLVQLKDYLLNNIREYTLPNGTIAILPDEWFAEYHDLLRFAIDSNDELLIKKIHIPFLNDTLQKFRTDYIEKYKSLTQPQNQTDQPLPLKLNAKLRDYQKEGFIWLINRRNLGVGSCLADDMGLGKTLQTIAVLLRNKELNITNTDRKSSFARKPKASTSQFDLFSQMEETKELTNMSSLIVVPKSLMFNWLEEFEKFAPQMKVKALTSFPKSDDKHIFNDTDAILITYGLMRNYINDLKEISFEYVVLDESQVIKNPTSLTYRAVIQLVAKHRLILTGTPIENSLIDLWSQMNFINPDLLGNLAFFKNEFLTAHDKQEEEQKLQKLGKLVYPYLLRRTKAQVEKDLPSLSIQVMMTEMSKEQNEFYETLRNKIRNAFFKLIGTTESKKSGILILQGMMKLRLAANHPLMVDEDYTFSSGKFENSLLIITTIIEENHKIVMFSSFVKYLLLFASYFDKHNIIYEMLTGKDSQTVRRDKVHRFQNSHDCKIFLISLKAGGTGLNITAAEYVLLLDPWWNPAAEQQAINRAHRIGQQNKVIAYKLLTKGTIEEKIYDLQKRKKQLATDLLSTSESMLKNLTEEEIDELFK